MTVIGVGCDGGAAHKNFDGEQAMFNFWLFDELCSSFLLYFCVDG